MKNFTTGLIAGGIIGVVGLTIALSDTSTRKRMKKETRKVIGKANDALDNISDAF